MAVTPLQRRTHDRVSSSPHIHDPPSSARVIVADDDGAMRRLVADTLRAEGHDVVELPDGGRLLVLIARCCRGDVAIPDLIVSDVRMPVMTGLAMLKGLRDAHWKIPVILMTAFPDAETVWRAKVLDARVLAKPFSLDELRRAARASLEPTDACADG